MKSLRNSNRISNVQFFKGYEGWNCSAAKESTMHFHSHNLFKRNIISFHTMRKMKTSWRVFLKLKGMSDDYDGQVRVFGGPTLSWALISKLENGKCSCAAKFPNFFKVSIESQRVAPPLTNLAQVAKLFSSFCLSESPVVAVSSWAAIDEFLLSLWLSS